MVDFGDQTLVKKVILQPDIKKANLFTWIL